MKSGYLSPSLEVRHAPLKGGFAVYARLPVKKDDLLAVWGGTVATLEQVLALTREQQGHTVQIHDDFYLTPLNMDEPADLINHSCDPNAGLSGQITIVAMREIKAGEEITIDYALTDSSPYDEFECACGAVTCRSRVSGNDWKRPELWARYDGYFSTYLQQKIDRLRHAPPQVAPRRSSRNGT